MRDKQKGSLILSDGSSYEGYFLGTHACSGEVVFTTGMSGYQETLTDPSFCSQIVVMTYPLVGNYGCNPAFCQNPRSFFSGYVISELCEHPSNWKSEETLKTFLEKQDVPVLTGVDTRAVTRKIREEGVLPGAIAPEGTSSDEVISLLSKALRTDQVATVSTHEIYKISEGAPKKVAVLDFGIKQNILNYLASFGCELTVYPYDTPAEVILAADPDGIFLSNGPGNPKDLPGVITQIRQLIGRKPIFGICLGHQLLALACGADTYKMKFGHRGVNQPVKDLRTGRIYISAQNHGYAVDPASLEGKPVRVTHVSCNDMTIEGLEYTKHPSFSVQYHPEACPGPSGHEYLFRHFIELMEGF